MIPYRDTEGVTMRERYRKHNGETTWGPGDTVWPFGLETLPEDHHAAKSVLCLCEGESDALALREVLDLHTQYVFALGVPGNNMWKPEWVEYTSPFKYVIILGDGDAAGDHFVERTRGLLWRAIGAQMPDGEDVRSMIQQQGADEVMSIIRESVELEGLIRKYFPPDGGGAPLPAGV